MTTSEGEASAMTSTKSRSDIIREIRTSEKTFFVRNNTRERISSSATEPPLSLGPAGMGEDVSILPKGVLDEPGFQRLWSAGKLTVTDDPSVEEEMIESAAAMQNLRDEEMAKFQGTVEEPSSNRDLVEAKCLISGELVYQTQADIKNMVPPLAPIYKNRAHEFVPSVSPDGKGGEIVSFSKVTIEKE